MRWIFVDDRQQEAEGLAAILSNVQEDFRVELLAPSAAREQILSGALCPDGMLIDVDLSSIPGERGSGPGIAQDIRVAQKAARVNEFPLVRYALRGRVVENIGTDPASDDLFDLLLEKDDTAGRVDEIRKQLRGVYEVYQRFGGWDGLLGEWLTILGLSDEQASAWCHASLIGRMRALRKAGLHVAAGSYLRSLIHSDGLLIDEDLLAVRLGVDRARSGQSWAQLLIAAGDVRYRGVGSDQFKRWWANGLAIWWLNLRRSDESLVSFSCVERVTQLNSALHLQLVPLQMPPGSPGDRPWSRCSLAAEAAPSRFVPVDPMEAVRFRPTEDYPPWVDPRYASLREALRVQNDPRLDERDLLRLRRKWDVRR